MDYIPFRPHPQLNLGIREALDEMTYRCEVPWVVYILQNRLLEPLWRRTIIPSSAMDKSTALSIDLCDPSLGKSSPASRDSLMLWRAQLAFAGFPKKVKEVRRSSSYYRIKALLFNEEEQLL